MLGVHQYVYRNAFAQNGHGADDFRIADMRGDDEDSMTAGFHFRQKARSYAMQFADWDVAYPRRELVERRGRENHEMPERCQQAGLALQQTAPPQPRQIILRRLPLF